MLLRHVRRGALCALLLGSTTQLLQAQTGPPCGTDLLRETLLQNNPEYQEDINRIDNNLNYYRDVYGSEAGERTGQQELTIPVVVHVLHNPADPLGSGTNIPYAQIISQIDALNNEFQATNAGNPTGIRFCLAKNTVPSALIWSVPTEPGVMRYSDANGYRHTALNVTASNQLLSLTHPTNQGHFPFDQFLNIWVVESFPGGVGGYSPQPLATSSGYVLDGVVQLHSLFGDNTNGGGFSLHGSHSKGKILAHEVGHYLNLYHTFQFGCQGTTDLDCMTGGDRVCDTPPCSYPPPGNTGVVTNCNGGYNTCSESITYPGTGSPGDLPDALDNHMYYSVDNCKATFSEGQIDRMRDYLTLFRSNLYSAQNLADAGVAGPGGCIPAVLSAEFTVNPSTVCSGVASAFDNPTGAAFSATSWSWNFGDGGSSTLSNPSHTYTASGSYTVTLTVSDGTYFDTEIKTVFVTDCQAINEWRSNWQFGEYAGVEFSTGVPVATFDAAINNTLDASEGTVSMSDDNGNLLFYTNGIEVYDGNHSLMASGLSGHTNPQQIISVRDPGNADEYYVFFNSTNFQQLRYFKVNVANSTVSAETTIPTTSYIGEAFAMVPHCNGIDYWLIVHGNYTYTTHQKFHISLVSSNGVTAADGVSATADDYTTNFIAFHSNIKTSMDGTKIVISNRVYDQGLAMFDFDNTTGAVSNKQMIVAAGTSVSGVSFSPDDQYIFYNKPNSPGIWRYEIASTTTTQIHTGTNFFDYDGMQIGPDGKIYVTGNGIPYLHVINDPNHPTNPAFVEDQVDLEHPTTPYGIQGSASIPVFMDAAELPDQTPELTATASACTTYDFEVLGCWDSYQKSWDFGDGTTIPFTSGNTSETHTYAGSGTYTVTVGLYINSLHYTDVTVDVDVITTPPATPSIDGAYEACTGVEKYYFVSPDQGYNYTWNVIGGIFSNGATTATGTDVYVTWTTPGAGQLILEAAHNNPFCGTSQTTMIVEVFETPSLSTLGVDISCSFICDGEAHVVPAGGNPPYDITWTPTGQITPSIYNLCSDLYTVEVIDAVGCVATEAVPVNSPSGLDITVLSSENTCPGIDIGTAQVKGISGIPPYAYEWSSGQTTPGVNNLVAGTYTVSVTDAGGCIATQEVVITENASLCCNGFPKYSYGSNGNLTARGMDVAVDHDGNVFGVGNGGPGTYIEGHPINSAYLVKFDACGAFIDMVDYDFTPFSMVIDQDGNIYVLGQYIGGSNELHLAAYDNDLNQMWHEVVPADVHNVHDVDVDNDYNVVVTGTLFDGSMDFGGNVLSTSDAGNPFLASYNSNGQHWNWALLVDQFAVQDTYATGFGVAVDANSQEVYVAGSFSEELDFPGLTLSSPGSVEGYIAHYDAGGGFVDAVATSGVGNISSYFQELDIDENSGILYAPLFSQGEVEIPAGHASHNSGAGKGFVCAIEASGFSPVWISQVVESTPTRMFAIDFDEVNEKVYVGGLKVAANAPDIYHIIAQGFDAGSGSADWSIVPATSGPALAVTYGIATNGDGNVYTTGLFSHDIDLGGSAPINANSNGYNGYDMYIGRIDVSTGAYYKNQEYEVPGNYSLETNDFLVYPNPTNGLLEVQYVFDRESNYSLQVINAFGKVVYDERNRTETGLTTQLDLSGLATGIYLIRFADEQEQIVRKVILE